MYSGCGHMMSGCGLFFCNGGHDICVSYVMLIVYMSHVVCLYMYIPFPFLPSSPPPSLPPPLLSSSLSSPRPSFLSSPAPPSLPSPSLPSPSQACKDCVCINLLANVSGARYDGQLCGEPYVTWDVKVLNHTNISHAP